MKIGAVVLGILTATLVVMGGLFAVPIVLADRIMPGVFLADYHMGGLAIQDVPGVLAWYNRSVQERPVTVRFASKESTYTVGDLALAIDTEAAEKEIKRASHNRVIPVPVVITPTLANHDSQTRQIIEKDFATQLSLPRDATLTIGPNDELLVQPGQSGQTVDIDMLKHDITSHIASQEAFPVTMTIRSSEPEVENNEVESAKALAQSLLRDGIQLAYGEQKFEMKPFTIKRLLTFRQQTDPSNPTNVILGIALNPEGLKEYITTTIAPDINRQPIDARFDVGTDEQGNPRVSQFALPQTGQEIDLMATTDNILTALQSGTREANLAVIVTNPDIQSETNLTALGIQKILTTGESDFVGSPKNRVHNVTVGASRYHGVLIPPNTEFSFLSYLGPVDAEHGFKPELVIKNNVTTPEFGGGLCQVSTTAFRAAVQAGLKITERRNHSYAVRYYGTPGFDATIYPPYTDLRFLNNTPGYILIQTKIEGTKLKFEFWGTDDGRQVAVTGPNPYNRQSNGAVRATLEQKVVAADGTSVIEDTFRSNYKSPALFPKVLAANGEAPPPAPNDPNNSTPTAPATN